MKSNNRTPDKRTLALDTLIELGPGIYAALNARAIELTGSPMADLPYEELRGCLESMYFDLGVAGLELHANGDKFD